MTIFMKKTLFLLRHAKSNHDGIEDDFHRPLTSKGLRDCTMIGQYLKQHRYIPEIAIISDSIRTTETTKHVLANIDSAIKVIPNHSLYLATAGEILKIIATIPDNVHSLMVVAHHPGLQNLATFLAGPATEPTKDLYHHYPTTALAMFEITADHWQQIDFSVAKLKDFVYP